MRELPLEKRTKVIKLFLEGFSYDEIAEQLGVAKGSITNIVEEIRTGSLPLPTDIAGYVDDLRKIAIDMRKQNSNVAEILSCSKIYNKMRTMGISNQQIEPWLDICRQISTEDVTNRRFIDSALELARLTSQIGTGYESIIDDYRRRSEEIKSIYAEIAKNKKSIKKLKLDLEKQKTLTTRGIQSLEKELASARESHSKSMRETQADLDNYLAENKLSWEKVNTVIAIVDKELSKTGLTQNQVREISNKITAIGYLSSAIAEQEAQHEKLNFEITNLSEKKEQSSNALREINKEYTKIQDNLNVKRDEMERVNKNLNWANAQLAQIIEEVPQITHSMALAAILLRFLTDPQQLSAYDLDRFVKLMMSIRLARLGRGPNQVKDAKGKVICECEVPVIYFDFDKDKYKADPDSARQFLADLILPLVKDRFVPKSVYETLERMKNVEMMMDLVKQRRQ
jgi:predicted  nucleic acid-binding Zn-ribbon protein